MGEPITVLLIHRDQPERLVRTVAAFRDQRLPVDIVVLDNASAPEHVERVQHQLPDVTIVPTGANNGFGPAANIGLRKWLAGELGLSGEYVALAPHDALPDAGALAKILDAMAAHPRAGLASAEYGDDEIPVIDRVFGGITSAAARGDGWQPAGYAHGTLLVARRACLSDVGLFDERYFAYCEEADLGVRARQAGWDVGIVWGARVVNPHMSSGPTSDYLMLRNSLLLVREHSGRYPAFIRLVVALISTAWFAVRRADRRPPLFSLTARRQALVDFVRGRFGPPPASLILRLRESPLVVVHPPTTAAPT